MITEWNQPHSLTHWRREFRGWDLQEASELHAIVDSIRLSDKQDVVIWKSGNQEYTTSRGYDLLDITGKTSESWSLLWKQKVPPKVKLFRWYALHNALPTLSFLKCRGLVIDTTCKWCQTQTEDMNHLFWSCTLAKSCWEILFR